MSAHPLPPRPKILIVDDDPLMRRIVRQSLDMESYELLEAGSGQTALDLAMQEHPNLLLLDVMMPGMDGFEVIRQLRRHPTTQGIPVILLTALGEISEKIQGMQAGADDYITKPFDPRELRARVQARLKRSEQYLQANPLTSLPGNPAIQQVLEARIASREAFAVMYFDLSNFKPFNDRYGWVAGDAALKMLGEIIVRNVLEIGSKDDFVGHIGGDDFIVITNTEHGEALAVKIIHDFDEEILQHYNREDRERGFMEGQDRQGVVRQIPIMTLAVAMVTNEHRELVHPLQVAQLAAEVKNYIKLLPGSRYAYDRRRC